MNEKKLRETLGKIGKLEKDHKLSGVSFATEPGKVFQTGEVADYVLKSIETGLDLLDKEEYVKAKVTSSGLDAGL